MLPLPEGSGDELVADIGDALVGEEAPVPVRIARSRQAYLDTIMRRNLFDSSKVGIIPGGPTGPVDLGDAGQETDLKLVLMGTLHDLLRFSKAQ